MKEIHSAYLGWAVLATVFYIIASSSTVFRLVHRLRTSRMWWDDYAVILPLTADTVYYSSIWVMFKSQLNKGSKLWPTGINSFWVAQCLFFTVIWSCRISTALTLARVFPAFHNARRSAFCIAVMCSLGYLTCIVLTFKCPHKEVIFPPYPMGSFVGSLVTVILVMLADSALVLFPIITLWRVKLPKNLRRIIISAFSGNALALIAGIIFCIVRYDNHLNLDPNSNTVINLLGHLEAAVSLTVSNLLVIVTSFYRIFRRIHDLESEADPPNTTKLPAQATESCQGGQEGAGFARETSIGRVSVLDTEDRPLSFSITRFSQLVWSSLRVTDPPCLLSPNISSSS